MQKSVKSIANTDGCVNKAAFKANSCTVLPRMTIHSPLGIKAHIIPLEYKRIPYNCNAVQYQHSGEKKEALLLQPVAYKYLQLLSMFPILHSHNIQIIFQSPLQQAKMQPMFTSAPINTLL